VAAVAGGWTAASRPRLQAVRGLLRGPCVALLLLLLLSPRVGWLVVDGLTLCALRVPACCARGCWLLVFWLLAPTRPLPHWGFCFLPRVRALKIVFIRTREGTSRTSRRPRWSAHRASRRGRAGGRGGGFERLWLFSLLSFIQTLCGRRWVAVAVARMRLRLRLRLRRPWFFFFLLLLFLSLHC
jgi:hypothetical protein